jgi:hypothetical protein
MAFEEVREATDFRSTATIDSRDAASGNIGQGPTASLASTATLATWNL